MAKNSLAIVGRGRLADDLAQLARAQGLEAARPKDAGDVAPTADFAIDCDAGTESEKKDSLRRLDALLPPRAIILTSCLRFGTTEIASWLGNSDRVVGFATFYPLADRKLIEIAGGLKTSEAALTGTEALIKALGKEAIRVKDAPGLTFPRILSLIINEAARALEEGVASAEEIDVAMRLGVNYPKGPLRWADEIGLDEVLAVLEGLQQVTGDDRYRPAPLLRRLVLAGLLGETGGRGFYSYNEGQERP